MNRMDGMNYAPQGRPKPAVKPGEFVFFSRMKPGKSCLSGVLQRKTAVTPENCFWTIHICITSFSSAGLLQINHRILMLKRSGVCIP